MKVYRVTATNPPTIEDLKSNKEKGLTPRTPEIRDPKIYEAVSTWETFEQAADKARAYSSLGNYVAELDVADKWCYTGLPTVGHRPCGINWSGTGPA